MSLPAVPKKGRKSNQVFGMNSDHGRNQIYGREGWKKKLGDGESGAGADALGGGGGGRSLEREGLEYCLLQESLRKLFENWENTSNYKFPSPISLVDIPRNSLRWGRISIDRIGGLGVF